MALLAKYQDRNKCNIEARYSHYWLAYVNDNETNQSE